MQTLVEQGPYSHQDRAEEGHQGIRDPETGAEGEKQEGQSGEVEDVHVQKLCPGKEGTGVPSRERAQDQMVDDLEHRSPDEVEEVAAP